MELRWPIWKHHEGTSLVLFTFDQVEWSQSDVTTPREWNANPWQITSQFVGYPSNSLVSTYTARMERGTVRLLYLVPILLGIQSMNNLYTASAAARPH